MGKGPLPSGKGCSEKGWWGRPGGPVSGFLVLLSLRFGVCLPPVWCLFSSGVVFVFVRSGVFFALVAGPEILEPEILQSQNCTFQRGVPNFQSGTPNPSKRERHFSECRPKISRMMVKIFRIFSNSFDRFRMLSFHTVRLSNKAKIRNSNNREASVGPWWWCKWKKFFTIKQSGQISYIFYELCD